MTEVPLQEIAVKISAILEPTIRRVVKEEVESLVHFLQSSPRRSLVHPLESSSSRGLQLHFSNKLPPTLFTNSIIRDEEHASVKIILVDTRSRNVIEHGPLSSIKVEILVLNADFAADGREDWSESEFNACIVREREGKRPLLVGDLICTLVNGAGFVSNVTFTDNSSWVRSRKFRLAVRALSSATKGTGIREAVSEAFVVLDHRGESYQKHDTPSLEDSVWRLRKISKQGASHKKLESHGINTVRDFLMQYHMDPVFLRNVLGKGVSNKAWKTMVKHANECHLDSAQYSYYNDDERVELVFNCVYKVIAVKFDGQNYLPVDALDLHQKILVDKLKLCAFGKQNELIPLHGPSASTSIVPSSIRPNVSSYEANLGLQHDELPERQLGFNISESASYPCTAESTYKPEDDSTAQSNQPIVQALFSPAAFLMNNSATETSDAEYKWFQNAPITTFAPSNQFKDPSHLQTSLFHQHAMTWGQEQGFSAISTAAGETVILPQLPDFSVTNSMSHNSSLRAWWCMIGAVVMWTIVRRRAAARRKPGFPFCWD
ncbi:hypothetical protein Cgig2_019123 [Carnegiea gigantea]|uniref:Uncharacterized protein n=1 Tax=Carnegiea gigantea TaxID=171969 RepID=A0A9Q1JT94_9CARY|nr:hypothetical protein Cgig2_019123 [Carnegiea gigantea]